MEQFAYEFNTGRRQQPIEACVSALQDAQAYAIANGNAVDQARLAALEKQVKEIQENKKRKNNCDYEKKSLMP